jgi:hypothetical protein
LDAALTLATVASYMHIGSVLQQQVGGHWQPLGFFLRRLQALEAHYSTFDRELLAADQAIKHFLPQVEGCAFQLGMDHKPLVAAMRRVTPPVSGRQQRHLAFISEHTCDVRHTPGMENMVVDALSRPRPPPHPPSPVFSNQVQVVDVAAAAVADSNPLPLDIKEMALQQILCLQVQQLLYQPGLKIGFKQVGDLKLRGEVLTGMFRPLVPLPHR